MNESEQYLTRRQETYILTRIGKSTCVVTAKVKASISVWRDEKARRLCVMADKQRGDLMVVT